jgi:hypothetical protein
MDTGGTMRPGSDADHSPPSNTEVKNEELHPSSPWRLHGLAGQLYFYFLQYHMGDVMGPL